MSLERIIAKTLKDLHLTLAVAESCSGGLLAHRITNIPGSSIYMKGGIIAYADEIKIRQLGIPKKTIREKGAVSGIVARLMASQVRKIFKADIGVGITGIAGPGGGSAQKPAGLTFIAIDSAQSNKCWRTVFSGNRLAVKTKACSKALDLLNNILT